MDRELLKHAKCYIEKMANGINPLTDEIIPDDDLINNVRISRCLFYVNNILGKVLDNEGIKNKRIKKFPFNLTKEELNNFEYSNKTITISSITKELNKLNMNSEMVKLKTTNVTNWLVDVGILYESEINGSKYKLPTKHGEDIGLYIEERIGYNKEYYIVGYPKQAQEFIINNFENLIDYIASN